MGASPRIGGLEARGVQGGEPASNSPGVPWGNWGQHESSTPSNHPPPPHPPRATQGSSESGSCSLPGSRVSPAWPKEPRGTLGARTSTGIGEAGRSGRAAAGEAAALRMRSPLTSAFQTGSQGREGRKREESVAGPRRAMKISRGGEAERETGRRESEFSF